MFRLDVDCATTSCSESDSSTSIISVRVVVVRFELEPAVAPLVFELGARCRMELLVFATDVEAFRFRDSVTGRVEVETSSSTSIRSEQPNNETFVDANTSNSSRLRHRRRLQSLV